MDQKNLIEDAASREEMNNLFLDQRNVETV